ncbi:MAG: Bax inhibitor-1 family protein [Actinomycetota bacterium]
MADEPTIVHDIGAGGRTAEEARDSARTVFAQVMFLVAVTAGFFAGGAYVGRDISTGWSWACLIGGVVLMFGLGFARRSAALGMGVLFTMGLLLGLGFGPVLAAYAGLENGGTLLAQAGGATALFIAAFGAYGYATRRDFAGWGRTLMWALLGLIAFGIVLIFVSIPGGRLIYSILGLGVFALLTIFDFNRLRRAHPEDVVWIACSIFLDVLNVFMFMLQILGGSRD